MKGLSTKVIEAAAVLEGLKFASRKKWRKVVIETDSEVVFQEVLNDKNAAGWQLVPFMVDIRCIKRSFDSVSFQLVRLNANKCADCVAHWYKERCSPRNWVEDIPTSLSILLGADIAEVCVSNVNDSVIAEIV